MSDHTDGTPPYNLPYARLVDPGLGLEIVIMARRDMFHAIRQAIKSLREEAVLRGEPEERDEARCLMSRTGRHWLDVDARRMPMVPGPADRFSPTGQALDSFDGIPIDIIDTRVFA